MEYIIIGLFSISLLLLIISFFAKDKSKQLETQFENFSISLMQEIYQLKKKVKILEEEILAGNEDTYFSSSGNGNFHSTNTLMEEVISYYEQGYPLEKIAELTSLNENEVYTLLEKYERKNKEI